MSSTLKNLENLRLFENKKIDSFVTVIGGLSGLNYLLELEPNQIKFFDVNEASFDYLKLIIELIKISSSPEDFISRIFSRDLTVFLESNGSRLDHQNQSDYLTKQYDNSILNDTLGNLSQQSQEVFEFFLLPFLNNEILDGKRNCRQLLPCLDAEHRIPVGGGEINGLR